jgi:hypothetical protein
MHTGLNMHMYALLLAILVALCSINFTMADPDGVDCQCLCCFSSGNGSCTPVDFGTVSLNLTVCDEDKCLNSCISAFPFCELINNVMQTICNAS